MVGVLLLGVTDGRADGALLGTEDVGCAVGKLLLGCEDGSIDGNEVG